MLREEIPDEKIFLLNKIDDKNYRLINNKTNKEYEIKFKVPTLYSKSPGYKIESEYSGPAEDIFEALIPKLNFIYNVLQPKEEKFESYPDEYEMRGRDDNEYCMQFQTSIYKCIIGITPHNKPFQPHMEISFRFNNAALENIGVKFLISEPKDKIFRLELLLGTVFKYIFKKWPSPSGYHED